MSRKKAEPAQSAVVTTAQEPGAELAPGITAQTTERVAPTGDETTGQLAGVQLQEGSLIELKDMPEEQLRQLAVNLAIDGHDTLPVEQLAQLIQAEGVLISVDAYTVNRERLDHDGESYGFGESVVIEDAAQAKALLALGAILESE
ncbi:MAG TPA: hypothetical protein VJA19_03865 [Pseudomonas sp.]|nr:hypothetical protein [Pseudomonas sp.]